MQITKIELDRETKAIHKCTQVLSYDNLMFNSITQLETFRQGNKIKIMSKDYFNVKLSEFDIAGESGVTALHEWGASECLIKFRQSPYVLEDFLVLSEKSIFYNIHLDLPQTELVPVFSFGVEQQGDYDFKQDFTYFDYGFHPKNILAGNFKNVFSIDLRSGKVSLLL